MYVSCRTHIGFFPSKILSSTTRYIYCGATPRTLTGGAFIQVKHDSLRARKYIPVKRCYSRGINNKTYLHIRFCGPPWSFGGRFKFSLFIVLSLYAVIIIRRVLTYSRVFWTFHSFKFVCVSQSTYERKYSQ